MFVEGFPLYPPRRRGGGGPPVPCAVHHRVPSRVTATDKHLVNTCQRSDSAVRLLCRSAQLWEAQGPDPERPSRARGRLVLGTNTLAWPPG